MYTLAPVAKRNALTDSDFHPDCVALFEALAAERPELPFDADTTAHAGPLTEHYRIDGQTISIYVLAARPARSMVPGEQIHIYSFLPADEPSRQFFVDLATHP